ncbi:glycosyltransferase family 1 protein [Halobacillus yeomjeoni]|uniref:Glycosyltransferase family 1 protein n=1 Tax=Halobacillus yeomjeoni TaxID=311194 RepID=A0A931HVU9_9BACI|nr:glycosyltransferase family 1 protein [Halobacillus yeomjeoni]MBH0230750.1 glycosyltransferase family 1 protein [Halobacillus yeomjeoni]
MLRVLHIVSSLNGGGVEAMLLNYYERMDHQEIQFDFITHGDEVGILEEKFTSLHSKIYHVTPRRNNFLKNLKETNAVIEKGNYDIVHCHQGPKGFFPILFAKMARVEKRIIHNHIAFTPETYMQKVFRKVNCWIVNKLSTHHFACGSDARDWAFGNNTNAKVINNAINTNKFSFNPNIRSSIRAEHGVENKDVIGTIARFTEQKNHRYLVDIFFEIKKYKPNTILWLIGDGPLLPDIKNYVRSLGIDDSVEFFGVRNDVEKLMQAMDLFLLPTKYEGLGIVYIEAQAAGLRTIAPDHVVPKETQVTDLISYVGLDFPIEIWVTKCIENLNGYERKDTSKEIAKHGYDINIESKKMENIYCRINSG